MEFFALNQRKMGSEPNFAKVFFRAGEAYVLNWDLTPFFSEHS